MAARPPCVIFLITYKSTSTTLFYCLDPLFRLAVFYHESWSSLSLTRGKRKRGELSDGLFSIISEFGVLRFRVFALPHTSATFLGGPPSRLYIRTNCPSMITSAHMERSLPVTRTPRPLSLLHGLLLARLASSVHELAQSQPPLSSAGIFMS